MMLSGDDPKKRAARTQAAIARTLSQELERHHPASDAATGLRTQLEEESARLAFQLEQLDALDQMEAHRCLLERPRGPIESAGRDRPCVLIVDDEDGTRTALAHWLSDDYVITTARDGVEGLERAYARTPDAVISDVWMPRLDGIAMVTRMKRTVLLRTVPVLFLTGQTSSASVEAGLSTGAIAYLEKPIDLDVLDRALRTALEEAAARRSGAEC
jgi:CheY-like chemotaxis protein